MKKRTLSLLLTAALLCSLTLGTARAVTPAGFTLFELSAEPTGGIAGFNISPTAVVEDGTTVSCPGGEMTVKRTDYAGDPAGMDLVDYLYSGSTQEYTVPAGTPVPIAGRGDYTLTATADGRTERFLITNRTTAEILCAFEGDTPYDICNWLNWEPIPGTAPLEASDYLVSSSQLQGCAVLRTDRTGYYSGMGYSDEYNTGVHDSDVYLIVPSGTTLAVPEGYVMSTGLEGFFGQGGPGGGDSVSCELSSGELTWMTISPCGGAVLEQLTFAAFGDDAYSREEQQFLEVIWLTEADLNVRHQYVSSWAREQVDQAIRTGLMTYPDWTNLTRATTRGEFATLMVRLYETITGRTAPVPAEEENPFLDVSSLYEPELMKAYGLGLMNGTSADRFSPNAPLTREQAATLISRLAGILGKPLADQPASFADNRQISGWAAGAVGQVQGAGIMGDTGSGCFEPQGSFTGEQSILTAVRLLNTMG